MDGLNGGITVSGGLISMKQNKFQTIRHLLLYSILLSGILLGLHASWLPWLGTHHIGDSPDGNRTLSAIRYHIRHDSSMFHFSGMHFPYGDRVEYPDMLPAFTLPYKWLHEQAGLSDDHLLLWFNIFLLLSFLLAGLLLFALLRDLSLPPWYAAAVATGILLLSPQWDRIDAHYGLAWAFPMPAVLYVLWLQERRPRLWRDVLLGFILYLFSWIHGYHMGIGLVFIGFYAFARWAINPTVKSALHRALHLFIQAGIPVGLYLAYGLSDTVTDRSAFPYGFFAYTAEPKTLFFPMDFQWWAPIRSWLFGDRWIDPEKFSYLGLTATLFLAFMLVRGLSRIPLSLPAFRLSPGLAADRYVRSLIIASICILLYSMAVPLQWPPFRELADHLGPLRQVRALARFGWMGFYALNIAAFATLFTIHQSRTGVWRHVLLVAGLTFLLSEGLVYSWQKTRYTLHADTENREGFRVTELPWLDLIDPHRHQAIVPVPFFHQGSEHFWLSMPGSVPWFTYRAACYSGVPTMGAFLNRTSLSQTLNIMAFIHEHTSTPAILNDLPSDRPLLLLVFKEMWGKRNRPLSHLVDAGRLIYEDSSVLLLEWNPDEPEKELRRVTDAIREIFATSDSAQTLVTPAGSPFVTDHMDARPVAESWQGSGCRMGTGKDTLTIYEGEWISADTLQTFSFWAFLNRDQASLGTIRITERNAGGEILRQDGFLLREHLATISEGWGLFEQTIRPYDPAGSLQIEFWNTAMRRDSFLLDEFLFRPAHVDVLEQTGTHLIRNNRWYHKY